MHSTRRHALTYMLLLLHNFARTAVSPGESLWGPKRVLMFGSDSDAPADSFALAYWHVHMQIIRFKCVVSENITLQTQNQIHALTPDSNSNSDSYPDLDPTSKSKFRSRFGSRLRFISRFRLRSRLWFRFRPRFSNSSQIQMQIHINSNSDSESDLSWGSNHLFNLLSAGSIAQLLSG